MQIVRRAHILFFDFFSNRNAQSSFREFVVFSRKALGSQSAGALGVPRVRGQSLQLSSSSYVASTPCFSLEGRQLLCL